MENYENIRIVGRGAYGAVRLCRRKSDDMSVVIKEIPVELMSPDEIELTLNEGRILSMLHHPNIVQYLDGFRTDARSVAIVMEYAEGGTLHEHLQMQNGNRFDEKDVLHLFCQIVLGLHHIHSLQILHRDLKTHNILLSADKQIAKIGDFGISKILSTKSKALTVVGTPCYLSPEVCEGKPYNKKSDIWSLGCILYEIITLKKAFEGETLPALIMRIVRGTVDDIPAEYGNSLRQLLRTLLHLDPNKRPSTVDIMDVPTFYSVIANLYTDLGKVSCSSRPLAPLPISAIKNGKQVLKGISQS